MSEENNSIFDIGTFENFFDGDKEFAKELVLVFLKDFTARMCELKEGLSAKDPAKIESSSHSMKGLLVNMGAENIASLAREIEKYASDGDIITVEKQIDEYSKKTEELLIIFNNYVK
jgi:HPt (histidine-containing phosphotransfer) domain-containing protein